jgi:outer membrane protein TolC
VARAQQELTIAETALRQQESLLKNALIRTGIATGVLASVRIVPTDLLPVPDLSHIEPIQDLLASAAQQRPELAQAGLEIENAKLGLKGAKSALLPSLDLIATLQNNALAGDVNALPIPAVPGSTLTQRPRDEAAVNPFFLGGYGTIASQLLSRNFPDYAIGFQLTIPLRNRAAQAEMVRGQLALRQQEIRRRQLEKQVELEVDRALIALDQARARYDAAAEFRKYQEETMRAEQDRYELGASTTFFVIQAQRDLAQARSAEIAAMAAFSKAAIELDRADGRTLAANRIAFEEAVSGRVSRPPDPCRH